MFIYNQLFFRSSQKQPVQKVDTSSKTVNNVDKVRMNKNNVHKLKNKKHKNRRPFRGRKKPVNKSFCILSCNANGLKGKLQSFNNIITNKTPGVFAIQETHMLKIGQIKFDGHKEYQIYEQIRSNKNGGGLALGVLKDLEPVWIKDGGDLVEALTVKISLNNSIDVRLTNAYGPQVYDNEDKKTKFWEYLDNEVFKCKNEGNGCLIMMDSNTWLGPHIISNDPRSMNIKGKLF